MAGTPIREFSQLVHIDHLLSSDIIKLTGITDAALRENGHPLSRVMDDPLEFIEDVPMISHNAAFDQKL